MCFQCLKKLMEERRKSKRNRDYAKKQAESPQSETAAETKSSETDSD